MNWTSFNLSDANKIGASRAQRLLRMAMDLGKAAEERFPGIDCALSFNAYQSIAMKVPELQLRSLPVSVDVNVIPCDTNRRNKRTEALASVKMFVHFPEKRIVVERQAYEETAKTVDLADVRKTVMDSLEEQLREKEEWPLKE